MSRILKGWCPVCEWEVRLKADLSIAEHIDHNTGASCKGKGRHPVDHYIGNDMVHRLPAGIAP